jgi:hypothetical protein
VVKKAVSARRLRGEEAQQVRTRSTASFLFTQPRSAATAHALSANPEAEMLALPSVGAPSARARSRTKPVRGLACSTKN